MTIAILDPRAATPSVRTLMERALEPFVLLGMPHLTPRGLSETWLMKELGHRHWLMLAFRLGMDNADFRTPDGREAYASICASLLEERGEGLQMAGANDVLEIRSSFCFLSKSRHCSRHRMTIDGYPVCEVELVSTFVARRTENDNHSLARVDQRGCDIRTFATSRLADTASIIRRQASEASLNSGAQTSHFREFSFTPDPQHDFNGAGLLYFANFQAIFSRALSTLTAISKLPLRREVFFLGNLRPGEGVKVTLVKAEEEGVLSCRMARSDGKMIALFMAA